VVSQLSLLCGHVYRGHRCVRLPLHFGVHDDGTLSWTVGMKWPNWRGRKVGG